MSAFKAYKTAGIIKVRKTPKKLFAATALHTELPKDNPTIFITPMKKTKKNTNNKTPNKKNVKADENSITIPTSTPMLQSPTVLSVSQEIDDNDNLSQDEIIDNILEVFKKKFSNDKNSTPNSKVKKGETTIAKGSQVKKKAQTKTNKVGKTVNKIAKQKVIRDTLNNSNLSNDDKVLKFKIAKPTKVAKKVTKNKPEKISLPIKMCSSIQTGQELFQWLIAPITKTKFFDDYWEKAPLFVNRCNFRSHFTTLLSMNTIDKMLRNNRIEFTKNIDITSYENGERQTHNPEGRALPPVVWDYYNNGCSVRLLNPQTFIPQIHTLIATLQEYFQCMTGANVYLTPPNSQGFAPHYDDIEAFVLQIEGKKHWKLYKPRTPNEYLSRTSSGNFKQEDIGEPFLDVTLESGDLLYFPRGTIHQACTVDNNHSLHITLSVFQKNCWGDLLENLIPQALACAIENDIEFRRGLPMNLGQQMGLVYSDQPSEMREFVMKKVKDLFEKLTNYMQVDDAVDNITKKFQLDAMPPDLSKEEKSHTIYGVPTNIIKGAVSSTFEITDTTKIRLLRANILRMVRENDRIQIYSSVENSKEYHEIESAPFEIESTDAPAVEFLIRSYPDFAKVSILPIDDAERRILVISDLWEKGLLMTENTVD